MFTTPEKLQKAIQLRVVLAIAVLSGTSLVAANMPLALGFAIGGFLSLAHFRSITALAHQVVDASVKRARVTSIVGFLLRYLVNAGILALSYFRPEFNFIAVVVGLLLVKLVIIAEACRQKWITGLDDQLQRLQMNLERRE